MPPTLNPPTTVSVSVVLLYVSPASPPKAPPSLNWTWVSEPPGVPPPPGVVQLITVPLEVSTSEPVQVGTTTSLVSVASAAMTRYVASVGAPLPPAALIVQMVPLLVQVIGPRQFT